MISIHKDAPDRVKGFYKDWVCVGFSPHHVHLLDPATTCLKFVCPLWVGFDHEVNYGLCRFPEGHDGDCADEVWYCDACDGVYSEYDKTVERYSNSEAQICSKCST